MEPGASTPPEAAAEALGEALANRDWNSTARLLAPDEIEALRGTLDELVSQLELDETDGQPDIDLEAEFGEPEVLVEGIEAVPIRSITAGILRPTVLGRAGMATDGPEIEEFQRDSNALLVLVERSGRWYVSAVGTVLENASRGREHGGVHFRTKVEGSEVVLERFGMSGSTSTCGTGVFTTTTAPSAPPRSWARTLRTPCCAAC